MKNTLLLTGAFLFAAVANAQTDTTTKTTPVTDTAGTVVTLIDSSIGKAYVSNPERLQGLTTETLTAAHIFPALGSYKANGTVAGDVTISLDETNKGIVWIEGLPQGRFKAIMKKAPSTYKIPAQKSESGKAIAEGSLHLDPATNELTIVLGQSFNDANPTKFTTISSGKTKGWRYTGIKTDAGTVVNSPVSQQ